jgi:hypothetical protein
MSTDTQYRRFDDIPDGATFADKFGRLFTKTSGGSARSHGEYVNDWWTDKFDTSREYYDATEDELEDCDMWDAWPFYPVDNPT